MSDCSCKTEVPFRHPKDAEAGAVGGALIILGLCIAGVFLLENMTGWHIITISTKKAELTKRLAWVSTHPNKPDEG